MWCGGNIHNSEHIYLSCEAQKDLFFIMFVCYFYFLTLCSLYFFFIFFIVLMKFPYVLPNPSLAHTKQYILYDYTPLVPFNKYQLHLLFSFSLLFLFVYFNRKSLELRYLSKLLLLKRNINKTRASEASGVT